MGHISSSSSFPSDSQEIPHILRNPKSHYRFHTSPSVAAVFSHINPVHALPSYFLRPTLILSSHLYLGLPNVPFLYILLPKPCMTFIFLRYSDILVNDFWWMTNVMHKFSSMCLFLFTTLYMFRAHSAHHQERQIVSIQPLVTVILCWWPICVQVPTCTQLGHQHRMTVTRGCITKICFSWWWALCARNM